MVGQTELYRKKAKFQIDVQLRCLLISSRVLFFCSNWTRTCSALPTSKSYCYISNSNSIHYSFTDLEFHLANKLLLKIFQEVSLVTLEMSS